MLHVILQVPQLSGLGECFKSSQPIQLTEEETEYMVVVVKHVFDEHVVFQFNCTNTVKEQILEGVSITMDLAEAVSAALCSPVGLGCLSCNPPRDSMVSWQPHALCQVCVGTVGHAPRDVLR